MMSTPGSTPDEILLERLRDVLLSKDRASLAALRHSIENHEELSKRIDPIVITHIRELEKNFPDLYLDVVQRIVDDRMRQKQDELINILYPRLGLLIKKYINAEFRLIRERIDNVRRRSLSMLRFWEDKTADDVISDLRPSIVEEVYIISHESGLLLGSASSIETVDKDMIAGMLTAIKAFAEDAFRRTNEELRAIQYGSYEIMIHNFFNYYIALAIEGSISEHERDVLAKKILTFAVRELNHDLQQPEPAFYARVQKKLNDYFIKPYKALPQ